MLAPLLALALAAGPAHAGSGPRMWGVGPTISTIAYPGRFPLALPNRDDGEDVPNIDEVGGDVALGVRGIGYLDRHYRGGARLDFGWGVGRNGNEYRSTNFTLEADKILVGESGMFAFAGGGLGFGRLHFGSDESTAELDLATYLFRGQLGGYLKTKRSAYEVAFFAVFVWPGVQTYTNTAGTEKEVNGGNYLHGGLEATVYFGDFKYKEKKRKKSKKK